MRHAMVLAGALALSLAAGSAVGGELHPRLVEQMAHKGDDDLVKVLVVMRESIDVRALDASLTAQGTPLSARHVTVMRTLKDAAGEAQRGLVDDLAARRIAGVAGHTAHWLVNAVVVVGTPPAIREIAARPDVAIVEPDLVPELIAPVAQDGGGDVAVPTIGIAPGLVGVGARRVWDELGIRGEGALVANLDTGVDGHHPALASRWRGLRAPWNECWLDVLGGNTQFPTDGGGHGTHTMGTMCGVAADDTIGVAPAAEWIAANAINQGVGGGFDNDILACFEWFADPDGDPSTLDDVPDAIGNSWGVHEGFGYPDCDSRWWDAIDACEALGPVVIFAAGNEGPGGSTIRSPGDRAASAANAFSVGGTSTTAPFAIGSYSSRGPAGAGCGPAEFRIKPEISAPGTNVYSSVPGSGYGYMTGTSMAVPHIAGVVALMRSANPDVDADTIKQILLETAHDLGAAGDDNAYGQGFVDAYEAVLTVMAGYGEVTGTVVAAATGEPVAGATVSISTSAQVRTTDEEGFFRLFAPAGAAELTIAAFGYAVAVVPITVPDGDVVDVPVELELLPSVTLHGVVRGPDGSPAPGAEVRLADSPLPAAVAGPDGAYVLVAPAMGDARLEAEAGATAQLALTVPLIQDLALDLPLNAYVGDDFESGDLTRFTYAHSGHAQWFVQSAVAHAGQYALQSGAIGHNQNSHISTTVNCGDGGEVSFWLKVSAEPGDELLFWIDSTVVGTWAGEVDWTRVSFPVTGGNHAFRWRYAKNANQTGGQDCAWIDDIAFPGGPLLPQVAVAPEVVEVFLAQPGEVTAAAYVFAAGRDDLAWSRQETTPWLAVTPASGTIPAGEYQALLLEIDAAGLGDGTHTATVTIASNDADDPEVSFDVRLVIGQSTPVEGEPPAAFALRGAVPNPFNPTTVLHFELPSAQRATLAVYDVQGRLVRTLLDEVRPAGAGEILWDGRDRSGRAVASGTYFARLRAGAQLSVAPVTLVR